jgi:hypothetical protein
VELDGGGLWHGEAEGKAGRRRPVACRGGVEGPTAAPEAWTTECGRDARRRRGVTRGGGGAPRRRRRGRGGKRKNEKKRKK